MPAHIRIAKQVAWHEAVDLLGDTIQVLKIQDCCRLAEQVTLLYRYILWRDLDILLPYGGDYIYRDDQCSQKRGDRELSRMGIFKYQKTYETDRCSYTKGRGPDHKPIPGAGEHQITVRTN